MTTYIHELLCLDGSGNLSVAHLTVVNDDIYLASQEADAVYTLDGEVLAATPIVTVGDLDLTLLDGTLPQAFAMSFTLNGNQYFMLNPDIPADSVASVQLHTSFGEVGGILYTVYGASQADVPRPYQGNALVQYFSDADVLQFTEVSVVTVYATTASSSSMAQTVPPIPKPALRPVDISGIRARNRSSTTPMPARMTAAWCWCGSTVPDRAGRAVSRRSSISTIRAPNMPWPIFPAQARSIWPM